MSDPLDTFEIPVHFQRRRCQIILTEQKLDTFIKATIMEWAANDFTDPNAIMKYIFETIQPDSMKQYFYHNFRNIPTMREHIDLVQNITCYIEAMLLLRPAVTFHDVRLVADKLCGNSRATLGPLEKMPLVRQRILVGADPNTARPAISLSNLIYDCAEFLTEESATVTDDGNSSEDMTSVKAHNEGKFLNFLAKKYVVSNVRNLGVKITNFKTLKSAAYAAKIDSFQRQLFNDKTVKLLRQDARGAIAKIRQQLYDIGLLDARLDALTTMPFKDAVSAVFEPFLREERRVMNNHNLRPTTETAISDPLSPVRALMTMLQNQPVFGELFQLSAASGAAFLAYNGGSCNLTSDGKPPPIERWRRGVFLPLLGRITAFLHVFLSGGSPVDSAAVLTEVIHLCTIARTFQSSIPTDVIDYKRALITALSSCASAIVEECSDVHACLTNVASAARIHLDLLPQMIRLIVEVLSQSRLLQIPKGGPQSATISKDVVDNLFIARLLHIIMKQPTQAVCNGKITLDTAVHIGEDVSRLLGVVGWPLGGNVLSYIDEHVDDVRAILAIVNLTTERHSEDEQTKKDDKHHHEGSCACIAVDPSFVLRQMQTLPPTTLSNSFLLHELPIRMGLALTDSSREQLQKIWSNRGLCQSHLLQDGRPAILDMRPSLCPFVGTVAAASRDAVMAVIASVPVLDNVNESLHWRQLYQSYWGDVDAFVSDNALLADAMDVRLLVTDSGLLRLLARYDGSGLSADIVTASSLNENSGTKRVVGHVLTAMAASSSVTSGNDLNVADAVDRCARHFLENQDEWTVFARYLPTSIPANYLPTVMTAFVAPLVRTAFPNDGTKRLTDLLASFGWHSVSVLQQCVPTGHPLQDAIRTANPSRLPSTHQKTNKQSVKKDDSADDQQQQPYMFSSITAEADSDDECSLRIDTTDIRKDANNHIGTEGSDNDQQRSVVEDIRRNEFGIGLEGLADSRVVEGFHRRMGRLVEHLSGDLYANPMHFVLELLQNADDNRYTLGVVPTVEFVWRQQSSKSSDDSEQQLVLEVTNNETGFTEADVRALCDIGCSTKAGRRADNIGRKGIGFKSVFLVSDSPEVHSNGYHLRFNRRSGDTGGNGLVPVWCQGDGNNNSYRYGTGRTIIVLPITKAVAPSIRQGLNDIIRPWLLLFLRRVRRIVVRDGDRDNAVISNMEVNEWQSTVGRRVILTNDGRRHSWMTWTRQVAVLDASLLAHSPAGLARTEVTIAVPTDDNTGVGNNSSDEEDQPVFAFLPIRSCGLRFIVNADFAIPASREDILHDSPWNDWLIGQTVDAFVDAVRHFTATHVGVVVSSDLLIRLIDCVPLPGEVPIDSPFHPIVIRLRGSLSQLSWLPDCTGTLRPPMELLLDTADEDIDASNLSRRLKMTSLASIVRKAASDRTITVLKWLGCQQFSLGHVGGLLASLDTSEENLDDKFVCSLVRAVHDGLQRETNTATVNRVLVQLADVPLWPLKGSTGSRISVSGSVVPLFLPPAHTDNDDIDTHTSTDDPLVVLRFVVDPSFIRKFSPLSDTGPNAARIVLQRLNVPDLSPSAVTDRCIVPVLDRMDGTNGAPSRQWLLAVGYFLVTEAGRSERELVMPRMRWCTMMFGPDGCPGGEGVIGTNEVHRVHLPSASLMNENRNKSNVVMVDVVGCLLNERIAYECLDGAYLDMGGCRRQWRHLFLEAGAADGFVRVNNNYPEIGRLLALGDARLNLSILRSLDYLWPSMINHNKGDITEKDDVDEPWISLLINEQWVPTLKSFSDLHQPDQTVPLTNILLQPHDVYCLLTDDPNRPTAPDSLLQYFPYCPVVFCCPALPTRLRMSSDVGRSQMVSFLRRLLVDKSLRISKTQSRDLYRWMNQQMGRSALESIFNELRQLLGGQLLVPVPGDDNKYDDYDENENAEQSRNYKNKVDDEEVKCDLVPVDGGSGCCWTIPIAQAKTAQLRDDLQSLIDCSSCLCDAASPLISIYGSSLEDLFVSVMGVRRHPSVGAVWPTLYSVLLLVCPDHLLDNGNCGGDVELVEDVMNMVNYLSNYSCGNYDDDASLVRLRILPCLSGRYRAYTDVNESFQIFGWRSMHTVKGFMAVQEWQQHADFLSVDVIRCSNTSRQRSSKNKNKMDNNNKGYLSISEFINKHFRLPVLEDEMVKTVVNRHQFLPGDNSIQRLCRHLEELAGQWMDRHLPVDAADIVRQRMGTLVRCSIGDDPVEVRVSIGTLGYCVSHLAVVVPVVNDSDNNGQDNELLIGGMDIRSGTDLPKALLEALSAWLMDKDSLRFLRIKFRKFAGSLLDLVESCDDSAQVTMFVRSHGLRIQPFVIDMLFDAFSLSRRIKNRGVKAAVNQIDGSPRWKDDSSVGGSVSSSSDNDDDGDANGNNDDAVVVDVRWSPLEDGEIPSDASVTTKQVISTSAITPVTTSATTSTTSATTSTTSDNGNDQQQARKRSQRASPSLPLIHDIENNEDATVMIMPPPAKQPRASIPLSPTTSTSVTIAMEVQTSEDPAATSGRIGEQLVYDKLCASMVLGEWSLTSVRWLNEHNESMLPYDFKLTGQLNQSGITENIYLEVKATTQRGKRQFVLSPQEVTSAWTFKKQYHLMVVLHSGKYPEDENAPAQFAHIPDLLGHVQDRDFKLVLDVGLALGKHGFGN